MLTGKLYKEKFNKIWEKWLTVNDGNINYGKIMANEIAHFCHYDEEGKFNSSNNSSIKELIKSIAYTFQDNPYKFENEVTNGPSILFFWEEDGRIDYQRQCNFVLSEVNEFPVSQLKVDKSSIYNLRRNISLKHSFQKIKLLAKLIFYVNPFIKYFEFNNTNKILFFYIKSLRYYDFICSFEKIIKSKQYKLVITFSDMKEYSNIVTQVAKKNKIKTATLQHAIYLELTEDNYSQAVINYRNFSSDYLLSWGKSIKDLWKNTGFTSDKMVIAGSNVPGMRSCLTDEKQQLPENMKFGVVMSAEYWKSSNIEMLSIAQGFSEKYNVPFEILFHPSNNIDNYLQSGSIKPVNYFKGVPDVNKFIIDQCFLLCHTTTLYLTSLMNLRRCFRFEDLKFFDIGGLKDKFNNIQELELLFNEIGYNIDENEVLEINKLVEYHFGSQNETYKNAIQKILND